ncbi:hypothetical protein [Nannocystis sp. SCPEA4]|uniref:hypothetical protein n=1 Tax=Nannocystis sp. SCPEA4 TaxID=2996787 RepID=UPI00226D6776|nr:hypothetical protein [Nannocystis sp. SCPEA4]MCY1057999.1 hypothetical protein [Nannocystis sp. SCPEA4]
MANSPLLVLLLAGSSAPPTDEVTTGAAASASPTSEAPASAPAEPVAASTEPAAAVAASAEPLDTEVPEPSGMGLQLREYRHIEAITGLDLEGAWESYEDDVREDGLTESFTAFARRRFRIRRNIGIGVTCWGIAALAPATYFWVEASRTELYQGQGQLAFAGTATAAVAVGAIVTGAVLWSRFAAPLRDLRDAGLAARGRPAFAPLPLPRGLGLGLQLAF